MPGEDPLRAAHERVQALTRGGVGVEVEAAETEEHRDGGTQLGEELTPTRRHAVPDRRQHPGAHELLGEHRRILRCTRIGGCDRESTRHPDRPVTPRPHLDHLEAVAQGGEGAGVHHDVTGLGDLLGLGEGVGEPTGQHVDELDVGVAHDETVDRAGRDRDLDPEPHLPTARCRDQADVAHHGLHLQRARHGGEAVVAVQPGGDGIPAEVDDAPVPHVQPLEERGEHAVERGRQLLRAPPSPELGGQRLGERGEAGDVDEQRRPARLLGKRLATRQRSASVARQVGLRVVTRQQPRGRAPHLGPPRERPRLPAAEVTGRRLVPRRQTRREYDSRPRLPMAAPSAPGEDLAAHEGRRGVAHQVGRSVTGHPGAVLPH